MAHELVVAERVGIERGGTDLLRCAGDSAVEKNDVRVDLVTLECERVTA